MYRQILTLMHPMLLKPKKKKMSTQTTVGMTPEQQLEIDQQVASRLHEMEIVKARLKPSPHLQNKTLFANMIQEI